MNYLLFFFFRICHEKQRKFRPFSFLNITYRVFFFNILTRVENYFIIVKEIQFYNKFDITFVFSNNIQFVSNKKQLGSLSHIKKITISIMYFFFVILNE